MRDRRGFLRSNEADRPDLPHRPRARQIHLAWSGQREDSCGPRLRFPPGFDRALAKDRLQTRLFRSEEPRPHARSQLRSLLRELLGGKAWECVTSKMTAWF